MRPVVFAALLCSACSAPPPAPPSDRLVEGQAVVLNQAWELLNESGKSYPDDALPGVLGVVPAGEKAVVLDDASPEADRSVRVMLTEGAWSGKRGLLPRRYLTPLR